MSTEELVRQFHSRKKPPTFTEFRIVRDACMKQHVEFTDTGRMAPGYRARGIRAGDVVHVEKRRANGKNGGFEEVWLSVAVHREGTRGSYADPDCVKVPAEEVMFRGECKHRAVHPVYVGQS